MSMTKDMTPAPRLETLMETTMYGATAAHATATPWASEVNVTFITGGMTIRMIGDPHRLSLLFSDAAAQIDAILARGQS